MLGEGVRKGREETNKIGGWGGPIRLRMMEI
jgi:hypothetical protein